MTAVEVLTEARALIVRGWIQGEFARNGYGNPVRPGHPDACTWCIMGALRKASGVEQLPVKTRLPAQRLLEDAAGLDDQNRIPLTAWNDMPDRTHAEVLAAFDRAIALAGGGR